MRCRFQRRAVPVGGFLRYSVETTSSSSMRSRSSVDTGSTSDERSFVTGTSMESPTLITARIGGGEAAFHFQIDTVVGDQTYRMAPIDVMTFDDDAKITSMKAYWAESDMTVV